MLLEDRNVRNQRILEVVLIMLAIGLVGLFHQMDSFKAVALNLFFLPVALAGFYLGRYRAGVLALFCVITTSVVAMLELDSFAPITSPLTIGLSVTIWGAVLGLTSLLIGTLSDEFAGKIDELRDAHMGVVEVLSRYLQGANPRLKDRANRVAELSQRVAENLKVTPKHVDDIRIAALLQDVGNLEITARVIRKAVGNLESEESADESHTFDGDELIRSLGSSLAGAFPLLLLSQDDEFGMTAPDDDDHLRDLPLGARIIRTVRAYDSIVNSRSPDDIAGSEALDELRGDERHVHDPLVLDALERVLLRQGVGPAVADTPLTVGSA